MKRENEIGAILGLAFGIFIVTFIALLISKVVTISFKTELVLIVTIFLFFTVFFGVRAGKNTLKGQHPILVGYKSTFLTTLCTLLLSIPIYILFDDHEYYTFTDVISVFTITIFYTAIIGSVPMLIIGSIYGYSLRKMVHTSG